MATMATCQICFDDIRSPHAPVTQLCGPACPAVLCGGCLVRHLSVALQVSYAGALPRVRCPICLTALHKSQWKAHVRASDVTTDGKSFVLEEYARLCRVACSFQTPCCHNPDYVHLPEEARKPAACTLLTSQVAALRKKCRQFGRHRIPPRDLITYITDTFPHEYERVFEGVLVRITDDERRAALLLSYHAVNRVVETTCCGWLTCFNCKRVTSGDEPCVCEDDEEFDEETDLVQCRSCRAMLVKVDGCDAVQCTCGFAMDWGDELNYRRRMQRKLLAVDPFDTTVFAQWVDWHRQLVDLFEDLRDQGRIKMQLKMLAKTRPGFAPALRLFIWRRRISRVRSSKGFIAGLRIKYANRVLVPLLRSVVGRFVSQRRRAKAAAEQQAAERRNFVDVEIARHKLVLRAFATLAAAHFRRKAAVKEIQNKFLWEVYNGSHEQQQAELAAEERAFVTHFNVALAA